MKLPDYERAVVAKEKITQYLLSETHLDGRSKAAFFKRFGFSTRTWEVLAKALREHAAQHEVADTLTTPYGIHYTIEGKLRTPSGRTSLLRTVWAIDEEGDAPRFITAYPLKKK
jgi:hypothetical protein